MGACINIVTLLGNVGSVDEINNGVAFSLATSERWRDDQGRDQERTDWHRVCVFGKRGVALRTIARKGLRLAVTGSLRTNMYTGDDGAKRKSVDVIASDVVLLSPPPKGPQHDGDDSPAEE